MTVEAAAQSWKVEPEVQAQGGPVTALAPTDNGRPVRIEPDLDFIRALSREGGDTFKKCIQCGTCSAACALSPDAECFPRKEMAWAIWGMKDRLLQDPDVWLCHQCNDCSTRCPRGARPGDVLGAVRREWVRHYSVPRFLGRWMNRPHCIPILLGIPTALLTLALVARDPVGRALGMAPQADARIVYSYSTLFPHWLLNSFFAFFSLLVLLAVLGGVVRFWRALQASAARSSIPTGVRGLAPSIAAMLRKVVTHENFAQCSTARPRLISHVCVFSGFLALTLVTLWVITAGYNPLIRGTFVYPFGFWNPWKILANAGGALLVIGCLLMIRDRLKEGTAVGRSTYFDWALPATLLLAAITGFITEVLHYLRLEPHRHLAYFVHLVFVCVVLLYLPYSKLAHLVYRSTAMVFAEYSGRSRAGTAVERTVQ
ncbi:MAG: quinone-interacting membrane-bound oxidoreductase complex subunit QmoC [Acidobacteriota bacterium]